MAHPRNDLVIVVMAVMAVTTNITAVWRIRFVQKGLARRTQEVPRLVAVSDGKSVDAETAPVARPAAVESRR